MSALAFANPAILLALVALPAIWWLLRLTPPRPKAEIFPPLAILATVLKRQETPAKSPWWLTLLRMLMAAALILAISDPVLNPRTGELSTAGPLSLVIDNSWSTSRDWDRRVETAELLIGDAEAADLPVSIVFTTDATHDAVPGSAAAAREKLQAARPNPLVPERARAAAAVTEAFNGLRPGTVAFLSDGIATPQDADMAAELASLSPANLRLIEGDGAQGLALTAAANTADALSVTASRLEREASASYTVNALDQQGRSLATGELSFAAGAATASAEIAAPFELRNDFSRLVIEGASSAGGVHLLDDGFKRRRVALIAGDSGNDMQPLLLPLYYISRALQPYADLIEPKGADLSTSIPDILQQNPSAIILADVGRLPAETYQPLQQWIARGGTLIRFAGPRLAAAPTDDPLVPVILRRGERSLGGALSWAEPQPLAEFPAAGPFAGMAPATDVTVTRQVLAEPTPDLADRTWASLADGTPLVTTRPVEAGRIILFHVSAEATWSNLPLSGTFVEMLRRLVQLSRATGAESAATAAEPAAALPPYRLLTAEGILTADKTAAKPISVEAGTVPVASIDHPPGLYGSEDGFTAVNLLPANAELNPVEISAADLPVLREALIGREAISLRPALFTAALLMLILDSLIVLFMNGAFSRKPRGGRAAAALALLAILPFAFSPGESRAQDAKPGDAQALERLDTTHLAYVVTGEADVDRLSEQGLDGLSQFLAYRTTLEPGAPVGLDITKDELSFYPIIYWPISATAPMPTEAAISRIDAYMRNGGTVLFDTRDQLNTLDTGGAPSANGQRLQEILANIDIPPLEPTPEDHVLTRAFYLLSSFPGRYSGSPLWVEARQDARQSGSQLSSSGDGVTPLLITGNDFAGAWAIDANGAAVLPTVPPDEMQREYAYRAGVNIMMYMLTGNYKADQVHVPALLERLGQ
ncbi:DUF4159 domain-containing protein [Rhizobium sp. SSA_523]|uniref:DUF4159 domain-containing protein n=1 Tax=Rhizobium sp. SSA_523 TaxID=2952477 RepID=UPI002091B4CA|nr:DUF4159 domain-containing protein [Rhizobium sp. SSA_523]MCO5730439.1 DUF4159 domain-containing protein [Rhizobium sp. SSA_523]WKC25482.1 DUF4159 domain-containing protein [Rhizobium sp. SSA_523]